MNDDEPGLTSEQAEGSVRRILGLVPVGQGVTHVGAAEMLDRTFRLAASWPHQKRTAEVLLTVLFVAGVFERILCDFGYDYKRVR